MQNCHWKFFFMRRPKKKKFCILWRINAPFHPTKWFSFLKAECHLTLLFVPLGSKSLNLLSTFHNLPTSETIMLPVSFRQKRNSHFDCPPLFIQSVRVPKWLCSGHETLLGLVPALLSEGSISMCWVRPQDLEVGRHFESYVIFTFVLTLKPKSQMWIHCVFSGVKIP